MSYTSEQVEKTLVQATSPTVKDSDSMPEEIQSAAVQPQVTELYKNEKFVGSKLKNEKELKISTLIKESGKVSFLFLLTFS